VAESFDRIQALRIKIDEIEVTLNGFARKAENPLGRTGRGFPPRIGRMIRYIDERAFADLYLKVTSMRQDLNTLEAAIDDADEPEDRDEDDESEESDE
jgi:hypothetical protein